MPQYCYKMKLWLCGWYFVGIWPIHTVLFFLCVTGEKKKRERKNIKKYPEKFFTFYTLNKKTQTNSSMKERNAKLMCVVGWFGYLNFFPSTITELTSNKKK